MPLGDYGLGGREARGAYESAKASVGSNNSEKDGSSLAPDTSSRPRSRPDNVAPVRSDDNKSSAPSTSVRPRSRPDNVTPVKADSISITNEDTKKVEAYIDYLTGNIVYKDNSRLSKSIKDNVAKNLSSLYPDFSNKTINSLVEKHGPSLIGGLTSEAVSMLSPEDRETLAAMQPLGRGINTTPESLREAFNISPGWKSMPSDISSIMGYLENPEQALETIVDRTSGTFDFGAINPSLSGLIGKIQGDGTISIGGKKTFAEGGKVSDEAQLEMELIMNEQVDPVSGNTAPVGAKPEEVRDDVEIRVSPGEYVINAQTVRYFGEDFFDELQKTAAEGFERIKEGEELPFRDDELDIEDDETEEVEPKGFAYGGRVKGYAEGDLIVPEPVGGGYGQYGGTGAMFMGYQSKTFINDETGQRIIIFFWNGRPLSRIPSGFREMGETPAEEQEIISSNIRDDTGPSDDVTTPHYMNTPVEEWSPEMHSNYANDLENAKQSGKDPFGLTAIETAVVTLLGPVVGKVISNKIKESKKNRAVEVVNLGYQQATTGELENKDTMTGYGIMKSYYEALGALGVDKNAPNYFGEDDYNAAFGAKTTSYTDKQGVTRDVTTYEKNEKARTAVDMAAEAYVMTSYASTAKDSKAGKAVGTGSLSSPKAVNVIEGVATNTSGGRGDTFGKTWGAGESAMEQSISAQADAYGKSGKSFDMNDPSTWASSSSQDTGGDTAGGEKVLCDLIHRYGYLDEDIWRLDEAFGNRVAIEDPELMEGYHTWAKPMVAWVEKESFLAKLYLKYWCVPFTRRWANHIAHIMEPENYKPDYVGKLMLAIGVPISRAIYKLKGRKLKTV
jgi:hypothetical protein